jgi:alkylation response protein AidB-like acyl-CoA dehydrogenase
MDLEFKPEDNAFREEVRAWIEESYPKELHERASRDEYTREDFLRWQKILTSRGWGAPHWPVKYGGTNWTSVQKYIFKEELARADTLPIPPFGPVMLASVLLAFGNDKQKDYFLTRMLNGEDFWCQGYSEPGAGSDLASLKTKAVRDGDHYVINGQKTWTTLGHLADWIFVLARTDGTAKKPQEGISFFLVDMKTPGLEVKPIITMDGGHEVNETWFTDVRVPVENMVGEENKGWTYAKYLLIHERSGIAGVARSKMGIKRIKEIASTELDMGEPLIQSPDFARKLAELEVDLTALEFTELRTLAAEAQGKPPGPESSLLKVKGTEVQQRITELALEAVGVYGAPYFRGFPKDGANAFPIGPDYAHMTAPAYANMRKTSIYGGSNEIQRNIISKAVLGL